MNYTLMDIKKLREERTSSSPVFLVTCWVSR